MNKKFDDRPLPEIAQDMIDWCKRERGCVIISEAGAEVWLTCPNYDCPSRQKGGHKAFGINRDNAKFNCFHGCGLSGQGLHGSNGLIDKLDAGGFFPSASTPTTTTPTLPQQAELDTGILMTKDEYSSSYKGKWLDSIEQYLNNRAIPSMLIRYSAFALPKGEKLDFMKHELSSDAIFVPKFNKNGDITFCYYRPIDAKHGYNSTGSKPLYHIASSTPDKQGVVVIVEGIFDMYSVRTIGYQSVALLGTELTANHDLSTFKDNTVVVALDGDTESSKIDAIVSKLKDIAKEILVADMPNETTSDGKHIKDPNDVLIHCGDDKLAELIDNATKPKEGSGERVDDTVDTPVKPTEQTGESPPTEIEADTVLGQAADATETTEAIVVSPAEDAATSSAVHEDDAVSSTLPVFPECAWRGVFDTYRQAQKGTTEAPEQYHFGVFKTVAGVILGRCCYVWNGRNLYPVFYTSLEGPTTHARKSTAASRGGELVEKTDPLVLQLRALSTPEGLLEQLRGLSEEQLNDEKVSDENKQRTMLMTEFEGCRCLVIFNELASLLKKAQKESSAGLIQLLTELYDCPPYAQNPTRNNPIKAKSPVLGIIGLTTKAWLEGNLKIDDIFGGFGNRFVFYRWTPTRPLYNPPKPDVTAINSIVKRLHDTREAKRNRQTEYTFDAEADNILKNWYENRWYRKYPSELDAVVVQRIDENTRKLALLYAVLENEPDDTEIHGDQLQAAIAVGEWWEKSTLSLFGTFELSGKALLEHKILSILAGGRINRRNLQRRLHISLQELIAVLNPLVKNKEVIVKTEGRATFLELSQGVSQ